ncbi:MAG: ATP-binding protein, partial [Treponema sp.]
MIERSSYIEKIRPFINTPVIKVLTGIRRCGKSVLMELIQQELIKTGVRKEQILSLNFESKTDERVLSESAWLSAVKALPGDKKRYLFFDEVQEFSGWEKVVNALLIDFDTDIYITGSNAKLLSGELATYLGGRYVEIKVYPFSFREVVSLVQEKGFADASLSPKELFLRYLKNGGFPFIYNYNFDENGVHQYLSSLYDSIVLKDISERHTVRDVAGLKQLLFFLISETGHPFSSSSLIKYLKNQKRTISTETIYNYIDYAKESCLLHLVNRQNMQGKEILRTQGKIYLTDHGLRETLYGNNMQDIEQVLENIVYMELLRHNYDVTVGISGSREIDFVAEKSGQKMYVQVCYLLA